MRLLRSRLVVVCVASTCTALVVGGIAWAVQSPVDSNLVVNACYNAKNGAIKLDVKGACPRSGTNTPISWNARGPQGEAGEAASPRVVAVADGSWQPSTPSQPLVSGALFAQDNDTCLGTVGYPCTTVLSADWTALPAVSLTLPATSQAATLDARFSASVSCFGTSVDKYMRIVVNGEPVGDAAPLAALPPMTPQQAELPVTVERTVPIAAGADHDVQVEVRVGSNSVCAMGWHLIAEAIS